MFLVIGLSGYFVFGENVQSDILKSLQEEGNVLSQIGNCLMILLMICHYPFVVYGARKSVEALTIKNIEELNQKKARLISAGISTIIVVPALICGIFLKSIDNILDFTNSLAGVLLMFVIPGLF